MGDCLLYFPSPAKNLRTSKDKFIQGEADWDYFEKLFDRKDRGLFEYQCKYLCANPKGKNWSK